MVIHAHGWGNSVLYSGDLAPFFYFKKTLATNTKAGFHFKSPKSDSNFFLGGGGGLRVSSHLCLLGAILRVP
jgi:hypothetical protein